MYVDRAGRRVKGSAATVSHWRNRWGGGPPPPEELERRRQEDMAERRRWLERDSAAVRADDADRVRVLWVGQWRASSSGLSFEEWLEEEATRLAAIHDMADELCAADRKLMRREAEQRAAAIVALI